MKRTNVYLDAARTAALDEAARGQGVSRAEIIRRLVDRGMETKPADPAADLAAIEESFAVIRDERFTEREPDAREAHLDRIRDGR